jgi:anti-sigma28 factor (negative regulator of flagellin synthesis)
MRKEEVDMIGIQGIGGVQEPNGPNSGTGRTKESEKAKVPVTPDGVNISPEGEKAAVAGSILQQSGEMSDVRNVKIAQARENLEKGTYKVQDVVRQVASRLTKYVS